MQEIIIYIIRLLVKNNMLQYVQNVRTMRGMRRGLSNPNVILSYVEGARKKRKVAN